MVKGGGHDEQGEMAITIAQTTHGINEGIAIQCLVSRGKRAHQRQRRRMALGRLLPP
jgi:hypothetical protein